MNFISVRRKFWLVRIALTGALSLACTLSGIVQRMLYNEGVVDPASKLADARAYEGVYTCQEVHGQTFYTTLGMPAEPGLQASLAGDDLIFLIDLERGDNRNDVIYDLRYEYSAHMRVPAITYDDGKITDVQQKDVYYSAKTKTNASGWLDQDDWFSGNWVEVKDSTQADTGETSQVEYTWQFIGAVDYAGEDSRVQLCSWYQAPDLAAAKLAGSAGFADFCKDWNYFTCYQKKPQ